MIINLSSRGTSGYPVREECNSLKREYEVMKRPRSGKGFLLRGRFVIAGYWVYFESFLISYNILMMCSSCSSLKELNHSSAMSLVNPALCPEII